MSEQPSTIFREQSRTAYWEASSNVADSQLRFIRKRIFYTWGLLGIALISGLFFLTSASLPIYAPATALVLNKASYTVSVWPETIVLFLNSQNLGKLQPGQKVIVRLSSSKPIEMIVVRVEPGVFSPAKLHDELELGMDVIDYLPKPAIVALANFKTPASQSFSISDYEGGMYSAQIELNKMRLVKLIPGIGDFFINY